MGNCYPLDMEIPRQILISLLLLAVTGTGCNRLIVENEPPQGRGNPFADLATKPLAELLSAVNLNTPRNKQPSHHRSWRADLMVLPHAEIESDRVWLHNIRDCDYRGEEDYDVRHFDRQVVLSDVRTVDFIVVPFKETAALAHTMLSFGLADGQHLVFSVEARLQQGQSYTPLGGSLNHYELMWVVGTERDLIRLRTEVRDVDVYLYPVNATPEQVQRVFLKAIGRVNEIARTPEFYDTLSNNCTTNIVELINDLRPGSIPKDIRVLLPGHSDRLAHELGLLAATGPFEQIKQASRVNVAAKLHSQSPNFSAAIRGRPH